MNDPIFKQSEDNISLHQRVSFGNDAELILIPTSSTKQDASSPSPSFFPTTSLSLSRRTHGRATPPSASASPEGEEDDEDDVVCVFQQYLYNFTGTLAIVRKRNRNGPRRDDYEKESEKHTTDDDDDDDDDDDEDNCNCDTDTSKNCNSIAKADDASMIHATTRENNKRAADDTTPCPCPSSASPQQQQQQQQNNAFNNNNNNNNGELDTASSQKGFDKKGIHSSKLSPHHDDDNDNNKDDDNNRNKDDDDDDDDDEGSDENIIDDIIIKQEQNKGNDVAVNTDAPTDSGSIHDNKRMDSIDEIATDGTTDATASIANTTIISGIDTIPKLKIHSAPNEETLLTTLQEEGSVQADVLSDTSAGCLSSSTLPTRQKMKRTTKKLMDRLFFVSSRNPTTKKVQIKTDGNVKNITSDGSDGGNNSSRNSSSNGQLQRTSGGEEHSQSTVSDPQNKSQPQRQRQRPPLQSTLSEIMQIQPLKKSMPQRIREKREEQYRASRSLDVMSDTSSKKLLDAPILIHPTPLHELCADAGASLSDLIACLEHDKQAVHVKDARGRLPLHVLGDCETRLSTLAGKKVATVFSLKLLELHPEAIVTEDAQGFFPFVSLIAEWMDWVFETHRREKQARAAASPKITFPWKTSDEAIPPHEMVASLFAQGTPEYLSRIRLFPKPEIWDEVEWCLTMLSLAMDEFGGKSGIFKAVFNDRRDDFAGQHTASQQYVRKPDRIRREVACHLITVMPNLIKCVLLIQAEGGETARRILKLSVFRRLFLCKESVGEWLTYMLRKQGVVSRRAVDFLQLISETKVGDYTGGFRAITVEDVERFHAERGDVFDAVNELESTVGSLVVLENKETERAASTDVIWHIMGERLARPFVLGLVLVDLVLHIALMLAFRNTARTQQSRLAYVPTKTVLTICSHYVIRKFCESVALFSVSPAVLKGYLRSVWTLFDLLSIAMTMAAFIFNEKNPGQYRNGFNAFVQGLLWMKVIGLLKVVNKDMSALILALLEIFHDVRNFMVVLVVVIFMFGDMFHIAVSTKSDGAFCYGDDLELREDLEGPTLDFCSRDLATSYLRVYSMLLGDFELSDLQDTTGITVLFVIFTSMGVVILLNVLIAVVSDSYEKATINSSKLFCRARALFVAQNEALEAFLKPGGRPIQMLQTGWAPKTSSFLANTIRWIVLLAIIGTALDTALFLMWFSFDALVAANENRDSSVVPSFFIFCLFVILAASLGVLIAFTLESSAGRILPDRVLALFRLPQRANETLVRWMAFYLVGLHSQKENKRVNVADDWTGRMNYIQNIVKEIVFDSQKEISSELAALEARLYDHDSLSKVNVGITHRQTKSYG